MTAVRFDIEADLKLTAESGSKFVRHHALYHPGNVVRVGVTGAIVYSCLVYCVVRCVACLFMSSTSGAERAQHTCRTLRALRMSPFDSLRRAALPSSVMFTLLISFGPYMREYGRRNKSLTPPFRRPHPLSSPLPSPATARTGTSCNEIG